MAKILLKFKGRTVEEIPLRNIPLTIGREQGNDIRIDNPAVSGIHARVFREGDKIILEDAGSTNGTFVNGEKISHAEIGPGDDVMIGKHQIGLLLESGEAAADDANEPLTPVIPSLDKTMVMDSKMQAKLLKKEAPASGFAVMEGGEERERVYLNDRVSTIGKSGDAIIKVKGLFAPKVAALVNKTDHGCVISPSDPKKPPVINGKPVDEPHTLSPGDTVEIGGLTLKFFIGELG